MICSSFRRPFPSPLVPNLPLRITSSYRCVSTAEAHASALALSDEVLYSALQTGHIAVFEHPKLFECARFGVGDHLVRALLVSDGRIITAHDDHKIRVWRCPGDCRTKFQAIGTLPSTKDYLRNFLGNQNYVQARGHRKQLWIQHMDNIAALAVGPDGSLLYSASWDKTVKVWELSSMRCIQSIKAHDDAVNDIAIGSDGFLYTASADSTVKVWGRLWNKIHRHALISTLQGTKAPVNALAIHADGRTLYTGGSDCSINVWEREKGNRFAMKLAMSLKGHRFSVLCLAVSGPLLCSGSADKSIRIWRRGLAVSHSCLAVLEGHNAPVKRVSISVSSPRSCFVYSASLDSTTKLWSVYLDEEDESLSTGSKPQQAPDSSNIFLG